MGVLDILNDIEEKLIDKGRVKLLKSNWITPIAVSYFSKTNCPEDYYGDLKDVNIEIREFDKYYLLKLDDEQLEGKLFRNYTNSLKGALKDVIDALKDCEN